MSSYGGDNGDLFAVGVAAEERQESGELFAAVRFVFGACAESCGEAEGAVWEAGGG